MMRKSTILFINKSVGQSVAKTLIKNDHVEVKAIYVVDIANVIDEELEDLIKSNKIRLGIGSNYDQDGIIETLGEVDFIITVYWPYLIDKRHLSFARDTINFHPALLPKNRGWYPHAHNIIENSQAGVSLHKLADEVDAGDIWAQQKVPTLPTDLASDLHSRLMQAMIELFETKWKSILFGECKAKPQDHSQAEYKSKYHFDSIDEIDLERSMKVKDFINFLRARTFGDNGYCYFIDKSGAKIRVSIKLQKDD